MTKRARHVALLVEDDLEMAKGIGELLASIGHDHVHAATLEAAEQLVDEAEFCYALLDLEIKPNADSIGAHVEAGESLRNLLRQRYPHRNEAGAHRLPIIMLSAHSEARYVIRAFRDQVDDYITKPIGDNFKDDIESALRKAGREKHEHCAQITRRARADAPPEVLTQTTSRISISGRQVGQRYEICVDGAVSTLPHNAFVLLLRLIVGTLGERDGWVHKDDLGAGDGSKAISRLRQELSKTPIVIDNDGGGRYRLQSVEIEKIDTVELEALDATIAKLAAKIRQLHRD